jgi:hypothetical protein
MAELIFHSSNDERTKHILSKKYNLRTGMPDFIGHPRSDKNNHHDTPDINVLLVPTNLLNVTSDLLATDTIDLFIDDDNISYLTLQFANLYFDRTSRRIKAAKRNLRGKIIEAMKSWDYDFRVDRSSNSGNKVKYLHYANQKFISTFFEPITGIGLNVIPQNQLRTHGEMNQLLSTDRNRLNNHDVYGNLDVDRRPERTRTSDHMRYNNFIPVNQYSVNNRPYERNIDDAIGHGKEWENLSRGFNMKDLYAKSYTSVYYPGV